MESVSQQGFGNLCVIILKRFVLVGALATLVACAGGSSDTGDETGRKHEFDVAPVTVPISVGVSGLTGSGLILQNNDGNDLAISSNGVYTFNTPVPFRAKYVVTVKQAPADQTCTVINGTGFAVREIQALSVLCDNIEKTHSIGGTVTGLRQGDTLVLLNNDNESIKINADGAFRFLTGAVASSSYRVIVQQPPANKICTVFKGTGVGVNAPVTDIEVVCSEKRFTVGGVIAGLKVGKLVILLNNSDTNDALFIETNGVFTFLNPIAYDGGYSITITGQPIGQHCSVTDGTGIGVRKNIETVKVTCSINDYVIGGTVSGLHPGQEFTLINNGNYEKYLNIKENKRFAFSEKVPFDGRYEVKVGTQPTGQQCTVTNHEGSGVNANIDSISVICSATKFTVGGTVSGLPVGERVILRNNDAEMVRVDSDGLFTFKNPLAYGSDYNVSIRSIDQPDSATCTVDKNDGVVTGAVKNIVVVCSTNTHQISGTVTGLNAGEQVTLRNKSDDVTVKANEGFIFKNPVVHNMGYEVMVGTQPVTQHCVVNNGSGKVTAAVANVLVTCTADIPVTLTNMHSFEAPALLFIRYDTVEPVGLMQASDGNFFGTTKMGGIFAGGSIFKMTPAGQVTDQYAFEANDLYGLSMTFPEAGLMEMDGKLYGSTAYGGQQGNGTIYSYTSNGTMTKTFFTAGINPAAELIHDQDRNLYGTSSGKTAGNMPRHNGTVFKMSAQGGFTTLHDFGIYAQGNNPVNGAFPKGRLVLASDGYLYGTTEAGGTNNQGTIFKIKPTGEDFTVVHHFNGADGRLPVAGLIQTSDAIFYGTTRHGGKNDVGTIFKMTQQGNVTTLQTLHSFNVRDGAFLENEVIQAKDGNFYGTTQEGGLYGKGTLFEITSGGGFVSLYSFTGQLDGAIPTIRLVEGTDGYLYGATRRGGVYDNGAIFKLERRKPD